MSNLGKPKNEDYLLAENAKAVIAATEADNTEEYYQACGKAEGLEIAMDVLGIKFKPRTTFPNRG